MFVLITHQNRVGHVVVGFPLEVLVTPRETKLQKPASDHLTMFVEDGNPAVILLNLPCENRFFSPSRFRLHEVIPVFECSDRLREGLEQLPDLL